MQLGFVSAILADLSLEEVLAFAADEGFPYVELMCWPKGKADRKYAGVTHLDAADFSPESAAHVRDLLRIHGVKISGLGYYPNPLDPDLAHRELVVGHLRKVIRAAAMIGVEVVNTFIGRDWCKPVAANLELVREVWPPVLKEAEAGAKTKDLCRKHGLSEATFYNWKAKYAGMTVSEARRLKELEAEGEVSRGQNRALKKAGTLPDVAVLEVIGQDTDGELLARPQKWDGDDEPPQIIVMPGREGDAPGLRHA